MQARLTFVFVAALAAVLLSAGQAGAYTLTPSSTGDPATIHALNAAEGYWHADPDCPQGITVATFAGDTPPPELGGQSTADVSAAAVALAPMPGCTIWLSAQFWFPPWAGRNTDGVTFAEMYCQLLTHEWGHLLGHGHSPDPKSVMYPWPLDIVPACKPAHARKGRHRATRSRAHRRRLHQLFVRE